MASTGGAVSAEVIEVIKVIKVVATRGNGQTTVFRQVTTYWSTDGALLAEVDPCAGDDGVT